MCKYLISNNEELKNLFYFFGILTSALISFLSLLITLKNRRNQLRESLYKEQINFASKLSNEFYNIHYDLIRVNKGNESNIQMATTKIENIFDLIFNTQGKSVEGIERLKEMMYQTYNRTCEVF